MIAAVVLASGFSRRMGRSKLTLRLGDRTFLERAVDAASGAAQVDRCIVVVRPDDAHLLDLSNRSKVEVLLNPHAAEGQSASIRLATERLATDSDCEAVIFSVVDQPFLDPAVFDALASSWRAGAGEIVASGYGGQRGNPVLFARRFFADLVGLAGDVGGRAVLRRHPQAVHQVEIADSEVGRDVDTWEEYERAVALLR
jgi:molybdenum cofactor cytidylyltransferase